jgi:TolB-like protein
VERPFAAYNGPDPYIFVSYAHDDAATVYPELMRIREAGFNIWYDEGIRPGSTWRDEVALALTQCSLFLFFVTPRSVESKNCQQELNFCLSRERAILCAHLEETPLSPGMELSLSDKQAILRHHYDELGFGKKLIASLGEAIPRSVEPISLLKQEPIVEADSDDPSIAVLALENRSSDPENEYLSDGISEAIIGGLSKIDGLRVASEIASFALKGQSLDLKSMGQALGVETILSGSVRKAGERVRVSVHLAQVSDGSTLWSERYEGAIEQIFELEDEVVRRVIDALKIEFGSVPARDETDTRTQNAEAYNLFLMGSFESRKQSVQGWTKAAELLQRSIALDPDYFDAYSSLVWALTWLVAQEGDPDGSMQALAISSRDEMERLDPQKSNPRWSVIERNLSFQHAPRSDVAKTFLGSPTFDAVANARRYHDNYVAGQYGSLAEM